MTKVLIHTCCGPCAIYPIRILREEGLHIMGYFYPHNIHPYTECQRREKTLRSYAQKIDLKVVCPGKYELKQFLQKIAFRENERCAICYHERLQSTAQLAKRGKFDGFTSSLLFSKFQNHDLIRSIGESVGATQKIPFVYRNFRAGWSEGVRTSKKLGMYRQPYCGCIYSEMDRYYRPPSTRS